LNLVEALPGMSWRRFLVLLTGLGPQSAYVTARAHREQNPVIEDTDEAVQYVTAMLG